MKYNQTLRRAGSILMFAALLSLGCRKDLGEGLNKESSEQTISIERQTAGISKEIASILEKVYLDPDACYEVNSAIYSAYYEDERVLLKDLLFPEISQLYALDKFKKFKAKQGRFRKLFNEELNKGIYPYLKSQLKVYEIHKQRLLNQADQGGTERTVATRTESVSAAPIVNSISENLISSTALGAAIYFPYSQNFEAVYNNGAVALTSAPIAYQTPTIVYTDREADAGPGKERYACGSRFSLTACFREVTVDDDYAYDRPTHIVAVGAQPSVAINPMESPANAVSRVYHGISRLTKQLDRLISLTGNGGGSEVKVARVSAYLTMKDQQVTNFSGDIATIYYKRGDIRNKRWKRVYSLWDADWQEENKQQVYAVYEDDTQGTKKFKGSVNTTINIPGKPSLGKAVGDVSYEVSVVTQDEIITQRALDRYAYFRDALNNQGGGYAADAEDFLAPGKDWPIIDGGTIWNYTMPYRIF
ncbi:MAG: hypothetical protein JNL51_04475 [Chitinophagaceae bacterium]|nr:hypothetical protein [Chitinophagaceae bacterium]